METRSKLFYDDVKSFHERTKDIASLLKTFKRSNANREKLDFYYGSARFLDNKLVEKNFSMPAEYKNKLEDWVKYKEEKSIKIKDKILKLELGNNEIFLFKIFDNFEGNDNFVISGYIVSASLGLRLFLLKTAEKEMEKTAEQFISIL